MFKRVLIANRGEIAVRIVRCLREMQIESVVVYSDPDRQSLAVQLADHAIALGGTTSAETYLNVAKLCQAIKTSKADAVHPGYGFLSENADFAEAVKKAGAKFIGPTPQAIRDMGDKVTAKNLMRAKGIPVVPGVTQPLSSLQDLQKAAKDIGLPLILKAAAGGGGRGMRVVQKESELEASFAACQREALAYFGNGAVFCERYIQNPRHIEFQVLFDEHGHGIHLFERDCSIQRRHQKLIEEAPSMYLNEKQRMFLGEIAVQAAATVKYHGAGTIEFICESPDKAYFMEMNTRIQVEHPITEAITGVDLIAQQIKIAAGEKLTLQQKDIAIRGWALECRINAEDPMNDFRPFAGTVETLSFPEGPFVRIDSYLRQGATIPESYDSMIAKYITWGENRETCLRRMLRCLQETKIKGIASTIKFHEALLQTAAFKDGKFDTNFIEKNFELIKQQMQTHESDDPVALILAAVVAQSAQDRPTIVNAQNTWTSRSHDEWEGLT